MPEQETTTTPYIFISHSSDDNPIARKLADYWVHSGIPVWLDLNELQGGKRWVRELAQAIEGAILVVVIMSKRARESEWVERETIYALELRKPILIARLDNAPLPLQLVTRQFTDFRAKTGDDFENHAARITAEIKQVMARQPRIPTPAPDEPATLTATQSPDANEDNFFAYLAQMPDGDTLAQIARDLYGWAQIYAEQVDFGGRHTPCFHVRVHLQGKAVTVFSLLAYMVTPSLLIPMDYLRRYAPYQHADARTQVIAQLNALMPDDAHFAPDRARPTLALQHLSPETIEGFKDIAATVIAALGDAHR